MRRLGVTREVRSRALSHCTLSGSRTVHVGACLAAHTHEVSGSFNLWHLSLFQWCPRASEKLVFLSLQWDLAPLSLSCLCEVVGMVLFSLAAYRVFYISFYYQLKKNRAFRKASNDHTLLPHAYRLPPHSVHSPKATTFNHLYSSSYWGFLQSVLTGMLTLLFLDFSRSCCINELITRKNEALSHATILFSPFLPRF